MKRKSVLSFDTNAKTRKGQELGAYTGILYFAPYKNALASFNVCPMAEVAQCHKACLFTAGRGRFTNVQQARINKTLLFHAHYELFMNILVRDIAKLQKKAKKDHMIPLVRLNGTSDICWERKGFRLTEETSKYLARYHGLEVDPQYFKNIMDVFPSVQFYDYTKLAGRFEYTLPDNYDLTFSYSGVEAYQKQVQKAMSHNARIAVVFRDSNFPSSFMGMPVINGDNSDIRHIEPQGVVVGLYAKGAAKKDQSGFVQETKTKELELV